MNLKVFTDIGIICSLWLVMASAYFVYGNILAKAMKLKFKGIERAFASIWLGWVLLTSIFALIQIFIPINYVSSGLLYFPAAIYFFYKKSNKLLNYLKSQPIIILLALLLISLIISFFAIQGYGCYDTMFYHLHAIRLQNEFPIIPGIANLHSRLGFNQLYFSYAASLTFAPYLYDYGYHAASSFILLTLFWQLILCHSAIDLFFLFSLIYIPISYTWISSPTPDIGVLALEIIACVFFMQAFLPNKENLEKYSCIAIAAILLGFSVTIRINAAFIATGFGLITLIYGLKTGLHLDSKKLMKKTFLFIGLFLLIWIIRGYYLSGCPFFPSTIGKIDFQWSVEDRLNKLSTDEILVFSRLGTYVHNKEELENYNWLGKWYNKHLKVFDNIWQKTDLNSNDSFIGAYKLLLLIFPNGMSQAFGLFILVILSFLNFIVWTIKSFKEKSLIGSNSNLSICINASLCLLIWFFIAPDPRFSYGLGPILFVASSLLLYNENAKTKLFDPIQKAILFLPSLALIFLLLVLSFVGVYNFNGINSGQPHKLPTGKTFSGLDVHLIEYKKFPFDAYLFATNRSEFNPQLRFRGENILKGFTVKPLESN